MKSIYYLYGMDLKYKVYCHLKKMYLSFYFLLLFIHIPGAIVDGTTSVVPDFPTLLLGNRGDIQLIQASNPGRSELIMDNLEYTMSCDYIYSDNLIFWMDAGQGKIQCTYTDVALKERKKHDVITTGLIQPDGLACDWIGKKLYWTDAETNRIEVSELDGRTRKVIIWMQLDQPRAIAVDPMKGYMYWTDWGDNPKIERAGMNGSNRQILVERDGIYWPNGLTIDYEEDTIYWVDANYHFINRMNTDGTGRKVVISNGPFNSGGNTGNWEENSNGNVGTLKHPFAITVSGNHIYWTDWGTNSIHSAVKNGSGQSLVIKDNISSVHDIHSYGAHRQKKGRNPCGDNNGGCSHLCLISPDVPRYSCACPTGVLINSDQKTCRDGPESILLLARRPDIRIISLDTPDFTDIVLPLQNVQMAVAIEYDPVDDLVYWTNNVKKAIFRATLDGKKEERIIADELEQCDGMAIDWVARNLYWAEAGRNYIAVSRLNGTSRKYLIEEGISEPRAIVLDPAAGQFYWSDWGKSPKIERASLDGSDRHVFINTSIRWPNGLALDYERRLLYWAEAYLDKIEVIGLDGVGRRVLLKEKIPHIFGFSLLNGYLYWSDWQKRKVERMLVNDPKSRHSMIDELSDLMGIKATSVNPIPATNPCAKNNGGCSHLCLYTPKGVRCNCPNGLELLSDMKNCIEPEAFLVFALSDEVRRISLETAPGGIIEIPFGESVGVTNLDVSVQDETIYWTDNVQMLIYKAFMNGTGMQSIIDPGVSVLEGIAVDWLGRNIYWADSLSNRIEMARLDSNVRRPVLWQELQQPRSIVVDPVHGYIYWTEWGGQPRIRRAQMDGSDVRTLLGNGELGRAHSLTIDYADQRLYWVDLDGNEIVSSNMTGGDRRQITETNENHISRISLFNDFIYWTRRSSIERANKTNGANRVIIQAAMDDPREDILDMLVYHTSRQTGVSACSFDNGGCEHLCLAVPGGTHKCDCPAHYKLNKDNVTCTAPENFLLFHQERYISRIVLEHGITGAQSPDTVLPIRGLFNVCAIDYDPVEDFLYWIDCSMGEIKRSRMNGTEATTVLENKEHSLCYPFDLSVEPYGRMLFWSDSSNNSINVMTLDGKVIGTVVSNSVLTGAQMNSVKVNPRKIAVHSKNGFLFFSSVCMDATACRVKILRCALDGSDCLVLFNKGLKKVSGMAVDEDKLYWTDEELQKIHSSNLDGSSHTPFVDSELGKPVGITIFGPNVYWFDQTADGGQIKSVRKSGKDPKIIQGMIRNLKGVVGVTHIKKKELDNHPCTSDNGRCSHICISNEDGTTRCSCPNHLTLEDFKCVETPPCLPNQFTCASGAVKCIPGSWRCDNKDEPECTDGSDEIGCPACGSADTFLCGTGMGGTEEETARAADQLSLFWGVLSELDTGQCIPLSSRCDGKSDCLDDSDEKNCYCRSNEFTCNNRQCILASQKCDGVANCHDESDESTSICPDVTSQPTNQDSTLIIIVIVTVCSTVIIAVIIFSFRKRKSRNNTANGVVWYNPRECVEGRISVNVQMTSHGDHLAQVNQQSSHPIKPPKKVAGGKSSTASVNVSIVPPNSNSGTHVVSAQMPYGRPAHPGVVHPSYGSIPPYNNFAVGDHVVMSGDPHLMIYERPNITGASSSSSSTRTNLTKQFPPTLNPPPSPATDRSGSKSTGECVYLSDSPSNTVSYCRCRNGPRRSHHHRNLVHAPPPPPTPCTSDTCDDFDNSSRRSKPSSPPPPYCPHCCYYYHHQCMGYNGYHPYPAPSSYHSSHHSYHTPPLIPGDACPNSSSSGSSHRILAPACPMQCYQRPSSSSSRRHPSSGRNSRNSSAAPNPPRYNVMSSDLNSDSDPFAPPPTPRSQYMSDCCYTHDEADDNPDDESARFVNRVDEETDAGEQEDASKNLLESEKSGETTIKASDVIETEASPLNEEDDDDSNNKEIPNEERLGQEEEEGQGNATEHDALLSPNSTQDMHYHPPYNPPPSPVTDSS